MWVVDFTRAAAPMHDAGAVICDEQHATRTTNDKSDKKDDVKPEALNGCGVDGVQSPKRRYSRYTLHMLRHNLHLSSTSAAG